MQKEKKCFWFLNGWGGGSTSLEQNPKYFKKKSFEGSPKTAQELQMLVLYTIYHIRKKKRQNFTQIFAQYFATEKIVLIFPQIFPPSFFNIFHLTKVAQILAQIIAQIFCDAKKIAFLSTNTSPKKSQKFAVQK